MNSYTVFVKAPYEAPYEASYELLMNNHVNCFVAKRLQTNYKNMIGSYTANLIVPQAPPHGPVSAISVKINPCKRPSLPNLYGLFNTHLTVQ